MNKTIFLAVLIGLSLTTHAMTLDEALEQAMANSPGLRAARSHEQAAGRRAEGAGLWENPVLDLEGEGLGGNNDGFDEGEYGVALKQAIPLGGKSKHQRAVAKQALQVSMHGVTEAEQVLAAKVRSAFYEALAQQEIAKVRDEQDKLGREFIAVAEERIAAGGGSEMDLIQANLALEEILLEKQCCFGDLDAAKKELASLMGMDLSEVGTPVGDFYTLKEEVPSAVGVMHPALKGLRAKAEQVRQEAALAKSRSYGDLKLGAGVKYEPADDAHSFVVSAMIPLPVRKKGRLEQAAAMLQADALRLKRRCSIRPACFRWRNTRMN
jgi:outer membrane protein, heavy metal efflux system